MADFEKIVKRIVGDKKPIRPKLRAKIRPKLKSTKKKKK